MDGKWAANIVSSRRSARVAHHLIPYYDILIRSVCSLAAGTPAPAFLEVGAAVDDGHMQAYAANHGWGARAGEQDIRN